jgi:integrase
MPEPIRHRKTGIYHVKGSLPPDIAKRIGKLYYRRSLGTREPAKARLALARVMLALEAEWGAIRNGPVDLTKRQTEALAGQAYREWMLRHGDDPPREVPWGAVAAILSHATEPNPVVSFKVDDLKARHQARGIKALTPEATSEATTATLKALAQAANQLGRHADGDFTPDPQAQRFPEWPAPANALLTFDTAHDLWKRENGPTEGSAKQFGSRWFNLRTFLGHDDPTCITRDDIQRWKDNLRDNRGLTPQTIREGYIAATKAILAVCVERGLLPANVATGVKVRGKDNARKRPKHFYPHEAVAILRASLEPQSFRLSLKHARARRWVPWLCAYTGSRVSEITQLRKQDVKEHEGVAAILITPDAGRTKNNKSRLVPLHPHLIEQGFLTMVREAEEGRLFCGDKAKKGPQTRAKRLGAWVRSIGVKDPDVQPNNAWRHLFKSKAREMTPHMDAEIRDYIQGHAPRTEGERYGEISVKAAYAEIIRLPRYTL